jgi:hypothetical protein
MMLRVTDHHTPPSLSPSLHLPDFTSMPTTNMKSTTPMLAQHTAKVSSDEAGKNKFIACG